MQPSTRIVVLALLGVLAVAVLATQFISVREAGFVLQGYTTNSGELTGSSLVGQTFVAESPNLSGVSVLLATYSNRANEGVVEFHLREGLGSDTDLRVGRVLPAELGDNQSYTFTFEPIADARGKTYFFYLVAPEATPGAAVAVDLDTRDPYHRGTAFLVREQPGAADNPELLARSGKPTVDVAFGTHYTVSLRTALVHQARRFVLNLMSTWEDRRALYRQWLRLAAPAVGLLALTVVLSSNPDQRLMRILRRPWGVASLLVLVAIAGLGWRLMYATSLPLTNDEGNYLYDAQALLRGVLAGGDGYVKAPLVIGWMALWQWLLGPTILAGRLASIIASLLLLWPLYVVGREMRNWQTGVLAAATWSFAGAPAVFSIYAHTQMVALLFGALGIALIWQGLRGNLSARWFLWGGIALGLGVASRKSILAVGLVPLVLILLEGRSWQLRLRHLVNVGLGFGVVLAVLLAGAWYVYGEPGVYEALGYNSAEDGITANNPDEAEQVRAYSLRGMTPFFRESLPLLWLALLAEGFLCERWLRRGLQHLQKPEKKFNRWWLYALPKLSWILPGAVGWWAWRFFFEYEGGVFLTLGGMEWLWWMLLLLLGVFALWPPVRLPVLEEESLVPKSRQPNMVAGRFLPAYLRKEKAPSQHYTLLMFASPVVLPIAWLGGLVFFYTNWIKFHANYIGEFIVPLSILTGVGLYVVRRRWRGGTDLPVFGAGHRLVRLGLRWGTLLVLFWAFYLTNYITFTFEHTGTFHQGSVEEAAAWAREHIPADQTIFTGAALVPYLSGHHIALDIAHPRWYAYEFTRKDPVRLNAFLPPIEDMLGAYRQATWVLREQQTGFSFLMEYSEIEAGLETDFVKVHEVENGSNPLVFYQRVR
jgi:4-amino-4-deoxy-L-arabinose transferase-like glycosyltransferase